MADLGPVVAHIEHFSKAAVKDWSNFSPLQGCNQESALLGRALLTLVRHNLSLHHSITPVHLTPQATAQVPSQ